MLPETKKEFLKYFGDMSGKISEGSRTFLKYLENYNNPEAFYPNFKRFEHGADSIKHIIDEKLYKSYMTPFEPADMHNLAQKMDSILDLIVNSQIKIGIFKLKRPLDDIIQLAAILNEFALKIENMVKSLEDPKSFNPILKQCNDVRFLKSQADNKFYELMEDLFKREENPVELFNRKQILEHAEEAIKACDNVSDIIEGIVLKHG